MRRTDFLKLLGAASILPGVSFAQNGNAVIKKIKPARLKPGEKIGLIAPGGFIEEKELQESIDNLKSLGFNPVPSDNILARYGYLGGADKQRSDDINTMFSRKDIAGIICARGGYGCTRILPMLDYDLIKNNPKVLCGYSDITALLYGIYAKTGLIGFHGPVGISTFNKFSVDFFSYVLVNPYDRLELISEPESPDIKITTIRSGKAEGELVGGNLSLIVSVIGTPYDIDSTGKLIFIEETNEEPYRIDRMLTQMIQAGKFKNAAGIILGTFNKCEPNEKEPEFSRSFSLFEVFEDRLFNLGIPVLYGLSFGHIKNKFTLPFGAKAELNSSNQSLTLLESAVL